MTSSSVYTWEAIPGDWQPGTPGNNPALATLQPAACNLPCSPVPWLPGIPHPSLLPGLPAPWPTCRSQRKPKYQLYGIEKNSRQFDLHHDFSLDPL